MTEEQEQRLQEYNERLDHLFETYKKYPTASVGAAIERVFESMNEDELLEGVLEL